MALTIANQIQAFSTLSATALKKAGARSLNRGIVTIRAEASRRIKEQLQLKVGEIKDLLVVDKASAREDLVRQKASLSVARVSVPLYKFGARPRKIGKYVGVSVNVKGERKVVSNAFIAQMKSGHVGIYKRVRDSRLPIKELFSTTVYDVFRSDAFIKALQEFSTDIVQRNFRNELEYQLSLMERNGG